MESKIIDADQVWQTVQRELWRRLNHDLDGAIVVVQPDSLGASGPRHFAERMCDLFAEAGISAVNTLGAPGDRRRIYTTAALLEVLAPEDAEPSVKALTRGRREYLGRPASTDVAFIAGRLAAPSLASAALHVGLCVVLCDTAAEARAARRALTLISVPVDEIGNAAA